MHAMPTVNNNEHNLNVNAYEAAGTSPPQKPKFGPYLDSRQIQHLKQDAGIQPYRQRLTLKRTGEKYQARCPWHNDRSPSFSIFKGNDGDYHFHCFTCADNRGGASGDVIAFVQKKDNLSFTDAIAKIADECGLTLSPIQEEGHTAFKYDQKGAAVRLGEAKEYLVSRGIEIDVAQEYGLGVADYPKIGLAIAMPYNESVVKFRAVNPASKAEKFRHLQGSSSANLLFGFEKLKDFDPNFGKPNFYLVESELDALTLISHGFSALSVSSATTCVDSGGNLKFETGVIDQLCEKAERIYIATDMDGPGQRCANAFVKALPPYKTRHLVWPYGGKDSNDPKDVGELYQKNPTGFRDRIEKLTSEAEDRARRIVTVYSDLPKACDLGKNRRPVNWLVQDILPLNDKAILSGYWGNYKSYIALSLAKAVATGSKFLGLYQTEKRPVIYLDKENSRDEIGERAVRLQIPDDAELRIWCEHNMPFPKLGDLRLLAFAEELKPLFIIDTLTGFSEAEDENAAREMRRELEKYLELISRGGTVLALHHPPKNHSQASDTNWFRGSGDIGAFFAMGFYVTCTDSERGIIQFSTAKSRRGPKPYFQLQAWPYLDPASPQYKGDFAVLDTPHTDADEPRCLKLLQLMQDSPGINQQRLLARCGLGSGQARALLDKHEGKIWRSEKRGTSRKFYALSATEENALF
jgi:hypothetical protein